MIEAVTIRNNKTKPILLHLESHTDNRGSNTIFYDAAVSKYLPDSFHVVQINQSFSPKSYTFRGLHYQEEPHSQAKLCQVLRGPVFNVALNLKTGEVFTEELHPGEALFIPCDYAHGFLTLEEDTLFQWCVDNDFCPKAARVVSYKSLDVKWPVDMEKFVIGKRDRERHF